jgi:hypothetical protein
VGRPDRRVAYYVRQVMGFERAQRDERAAEGGSGSGVAAGKRAATDRLPTVQRKAASAAVPELMPQAVQRKAGAADDPFGLHLEPHAHDHDHPDPAATGEIGQRVPGNAGDLLVDPAGGKAANFEAASEGVMVLLSRLDSEMTPDEKKAFRDELFAGAGGVGAFIKLPFEEMMTRVQAALVKVKPDLKMGDPSQFLIGPRTATDDDKNLKKLVKNATRVINQVIGGSHDKDLKQVFGKSHVEQARERYEHGRNWMRRLDREDKILTDRSGFTDQAFIGGLTRFRTRIVLNPSVLDNPDDNESIITMIHEAMHAGTSGLTDKGYIDMDNFDKAEADVKLTNAAHFEVVPRRILKMEFAYAGVTFVPAGGKNGGKSEPPLTANEQALKDASEAVRKAWTAGIRIHTRLHNVWKTPSLWTSDPEMPASMPFWSKVEHMTIHKKSDIDPASASEAKHPVSQLDLAISEGTIHRLGLAMHEMPKSQTELGELEKKADPAALASAQAAVASHRDLIISLVIADPKIQPTVGDGARNLRVVTTMSDGSDSVTAARNPDDFAD